MPRTPTLKLVVQYRSEAEEHMDLIYKIDQHEDDYPELQHIYHIPNGEERPARTYTRKDGTTGRYCPAGVKLKRMGLKRGMPDLHLPVARGTFHSFYIEMKSCDPNDTTSKEQDDKIADLRAQGHCVAVCHGCLAAWKMLMWYLSLGSPCACPCFDDPLAKELRYAA